MALLHLLQLRFDDVLCLNNSEGYLSLIFVSQSHQALHYSISIYMTSVLGFYELYTERV